MPSQQSRTPSADVVCLPQPGARFRMPSGMGGSFDVRVHAIAEGMVEVRVDEPRNPDWNGYPMTVKPDVLAPIPRRFEIRTRIGKTTGKPDDFLRWATVDTMEQAEEEARQAAHYPACHPIKIVEVEG